MNVLTLLGIGETGGVGGAAPLTCHRAERRNRRGGDLRHAHASMEEEVACACSQPTLLLFVAKRIVSLKSERIYREIM